MIYLDNAATTQMSECALEALMYASKGCYGNPSATYAHGRAARKLLEEARTIVAKCIGAEPEEIFFTSCGTESDNWAISQADSLNCEKVITSQIEHHAVLNPVKNLELKGIKTVYLPVDSRCVVKSDSLKAELSGKRTFVSVMYQNNETGVVQPIKQFAEMVHEDNPASIFHTDAVQAVGHVKMDVKELGVDMLSASAHKFNGPKGVGFLYVRKGCSVTPFICGGGQERGLRSGTENVAGIYAMAKALEENIAELDHHTSHIRNLEKAFWDGLIQHKINYRINADNDLRTAGVVNVSINDVDGEGLMNMLDLHEICISVGSACNTKVKEPSYVLTAMGMDATSIEASVRISIGYSNTLKEIDELVKNIAIFCKASFNNE